LVATILLSFILLFHFCFLMRDPQWLYTWDSKEGMGGLDRISSLLETWGGRASALLFGRNYPPFVPNFGQNVALSRENDHKFESLLRY
jgi:hypothetical protein